MIEKEIHYHTRTERQKQECRMRYDWSTRAAFESIDSARYGQIDHRNVSSFLRLNGHYATESEQVAIIRRLDVDAD